MRGLPSSFLLLAWALTGLSMGLLTALIVRRRLRQRYFRRSDRWRVAAQSQLNTWLVSGGCPKDWLCNPGQRQILLEVMLAAMEQDNTHTVAAIHAALEKWGLMDYQMSAVRSSRGLDRATAIIQLGRMRQRRAIPFLAEMLQDSNPDVRLAAVRALERQAKPEAAEPLLSTFEELCNVASIPSLQRALIRCCEKNPEVLVPHIKRYGGKTQTILIRVLAEVATSDQLEELQELVESADPQIRAHAARGLGRLPHPAALKLLLKLTSDPVWFVQVRALRSLGEMDDESTIDILLGALDSENSDVRRAALESLAREPVPMDELITKASERLSLQALGGLLGELGREGLFWRLAEQLSSSVPLVRQFAEQCLSLAIAAGAHKTLVDAVIYAQPAVADAVADFLRRHGDERLLADVNKQAERFPKESQNFERLVHVREQIVRGVCS